MLRSLRFAIVLSAFCLTASLSGCGGSGNTSEEGGSSGGRTFVTVGTAPDGGAFAPVGNAIANVVAENKGDLNWQVTPSGTKGTQENIRKLAAGEIDFGMSNAGIAYAALKGEGAWGKPFEVRSVCTLAPNVGVFVTTKGSGIEKLTDLKDKRVVLGPSGAGFDYFLKPLFKAHGLTYEDIGDGNVLHGTYFTAADMIADGKADAAFMGGAIPIPAVTQLCSTQDVVFIKLDDGIADKLEEPYYFPVTIPADKYSDLDADFEGLNVGNMQLVTYATVDEELVYNFTKVLFENRDQVGEKHPAGKALNPKNAVRDTGVPFHPGAIRYYKEAGIWPEDSGDSEAETEAE